MLDLKMGDIILVRLNGDGHKQSGVRPCLVVSNDIANKFSPLVDIIPFTSKEKKPLPVHVKVYPSRKNGLSAESTLMIEQKTVVDKRDVLSFLGKIESIYYNDIGTAMIMQNPIISLLFQGDFMDTPMYQQALSLAS